MNSVDNADIYVPPFDPGETRTGSQGVQRREQSLALEFTQFAPGDTLEAYKTFSLDENYSRYGSLTWYVAGYQVPGYVPATDTLWYFVRFASDELGNSYYEYRAPLPPSSRPQAIAWSAVTLALTDMSNLKLRPGFPKVNPILYETDGPEGVKYVIKGRPSFTRLRRISVGLINGNGVTARTWPSGQLWVDEFRATDVAAEQRPALGKFLLQIERDRPRVGDDAAIMFEDRHLALAAEADRRLVADRNGMRRERQALVMQGQTRPPGKRAVAAVVAAAEFPQFQHGGLARA